MALPAAALAATALLALPAAALAQSADDDPPSEPRVTSSEVLRLPAAGRCVRFGQVRMRLRMPGKLELSHLRIRLRGVTVAEVRRLRRSLSAMILLPLHGRATVQLTARTAGGRTLRVSRRYRTCDKPRVVRDPDAPRGPVIFEGGGED